MEFLEAMKRRRSIYQISKASPVPDGRIRELVSEALRHTPSSFNMQSTRCVLLLGGEHDKLWTIVLDALREVVPDDKFGAAEKKIASFQAGYGTVLYYDDTAVVENFAAQYETYRENFMVWAEQSNGMFQYAVWCLLEAEGLGANLQHYNPLIDEKVRIAWNIPDSWRLTAQMPFGTPVAQPGEKRFVEMETRMKQFG